MIIRLLTLLFSAVIAQIPPQPIITTSSACLNDCLQQGSLVFAAANLRNFQKIILNIEQFCDTHEQLVKCAQSCRDDERQNLAQRIALSSYICKNKLEEFRLAKECVEGQETDYVGQCANDCGHPASATIQLDSSPSAAVNPFAFFDSITPICRTMECIIKCSISESNKKCAGSGDLFRDIGFKQVMEASERLHNDLFNSSSSVAQQLAKIYLEALPEQCAYITDPVKYDTLFATHEINDGSEMVTEIVSNDEGRSTKEPSSTMGEEETKSTTVGTFGANNDDVITRIFDVQIGAKATITPPSGTDTTPKESEREMTMATAAALKPVNEPDTSLGPPSPDYAAADAESTDNRSTLPEMPIQIQKQLVPPQVDMEHMPEQEEQPVPGTLAPGSVEGDEFEPKEKITTNGEHHHQEQLHEKDEHEEHEEDEEERESMMMSSASDEATTTATILKTNESEEETYEVRDDKELQQVTTPATAPDTERTIMVINEDNDHETDRNTYQEHKEPEYQKDLKRSGARERISLLLLLLLPLVPLCYFSQ